LIRQNSPGSSLSTGGERNRSHKPACDDACLRDRYVAPHPRIPLIECLDVDKGHFPIGSSHDAVMLTSDNKVNVVS
jgi:hypothetical protein